MLCHDLFTFTGWIPCQQWIFERQNHVHFSCSISPPNSQLQEGKRSHTTTQNPSQLLQVQGKLVVGGIIQLRWQNPFAFGRVHLLNASWLWSGLFQNLLQQEMLKTHKLKLMSILGKYFYINYFLFLICCVQICLKVFLISNTYTHLSPEWGSREQRNISVPCS